MGCVEGTCQISLSKEIRKKKNYLSMDIEIVTLLYTFNEAKVH